ncbi:aminophospholipid-translocating P4-type ATPase [Saccharomycopsis crataegensis]|uniref:Phospholipid-transporting ATPase n=1 Tax=Saccharomycopsis crataegensis TaxID=43959 RepID=A0AAV5QFC8_9ASCO|nr:aminophospholipid-translocating P4-type ATPase [Saccharomycopsis crataegensis]
MFNNHNHINHKERQTSDINHVDVSGSPSTVITDSQNVDNTNDIPYSPSLDMTPENGATQFPATIDTTLANENGRQFSHSSPATTVIRPSGTFETAPNRNSMPSMKPPIVSPKRSRGMSLRSQLLNRTLENNLKAAYNNKDHEETYIDNIELQSSIKPSTSTKTSSSPNVHERSVSRNHSNKNSGSSVNLSSTSTNIHLKKTASYPKAHQKTYSINRMIQSIKYTFGLAKLRPTRDGRKIPLGLEQFDFQIFSDDNPDFHDQFSPGDISYYYDGSQNLLVDERSSQPYVNNQVVSSRYNILNFLPKQLYAQFSKLANVYFMTIAIMQLVPNWSTTGTSTTIIPLSIFISISIAREGIDDLRRHSQDKQENNKKVRVLVEDPEEARRQLLDKNFDKRMSMVSKLSDRSDNSTTELNQDFNNPQSPTNATASRDSTPPSENDHVHSVNSFANSALLNDVDICEKKTNWKNLRVGSIIKLGQDEAVPSDIIILTSDNENSEVFVETMDLDGETNLKTKVPHSELNDACNSAAKLSNVKGVVTTEDPNQNLYSFEGHFILNNKKYPLTNDNIVYRGSVIRNTNCVLGLVIFSGEESKIRMNAIKNPRTKAPHMQRTINIIIAFMICVVVGLSVGSFIAEKVIYKRTKNRFEYLMGKDVGSMPTFMSFIIMYNTLIPLSLYVTMELIKVAQLLFLQFDVDLYYGPTNTPAEAKTATILEELGQVSYIFSDKTGTLTDNLMVFRKFSISGVPWIHDLDQILEELEARPEGIDNNNNNITPYTSGSPSFGRSSYDVSRKGSHDFRNSLDRKGSVDIRRGTGTLHYSGRPSMAVIDVKSFSSNAASPSLKLTATNFTEITTNKSHLKSSIELINFIQTNPHLPYAQRAKFFILSLALCHTCFPKRLAGNDDNDDIEYQSSSPDELALVTAARDMGFVVYDKRQNTLILKTYPSGLDKPAVSESYVILDIIEFNSVRKRMSCIIRFPDGRKCLICKGADNVILQRLKASYNSSEASEKIAKNSKLRKEAEAEYVINERNSNSADLFQKSTISNIRKSMTMKRTNNDQIANELVNDILAEKDNRMSSEIDRIAENSRKSLHLDQQRRYGLTPTDSPKMGDGQFHNSLGGYLIDDELLGNDQYIAEKTLEHIDEFSTDGLRTLLYGYRWLSDSDYDQFSQRYYEAKTALVDRQLKMDTVGEEIEADLDLCGATAIEDKLQEGVPDAIEKFHNAGIKMWMLTGDKRETAINIGYSCGLIKNVSTVVILNGDEDDEAGLLAKMEAAILEIKDQNVAHCVVVIDGMTLTQVENDITMMNMFIEFGCVADAVICCRASPSQKAKLVGVVKNKYKEQVTLAIGDGANDIAMIQSADIGIGITGKEGLQAARSSDYSIAQFRFLVKLLLVHGRYNYIRTTKFVLFTFYKEFMFYLSQAIFQRNTLWTGTSLYEPWSLSMFNTLFTSLPVLCIGIFEKDLRPATLIANPWLYRQGRENRSFNLPIFMYNMFLATATSAMVTLLSWKLWGNSAARDNTIMPNGVMTYTVFVILVNVKCQMLDMRNRNVFAFLSVIIECGGVFAWNFLITQLYNDSASLIYRVSSGITQEFGKDWSWWAGLAYLTVVGLLVDIVIQVLRNWWFPTATDYFQEFEKNFVLRSRFEQLAYRYLWQSWEFAKDKNFAKVRNLFGGGGSNADGLRVPDPSLSLTSVNPRLGNGVVDADMKGTIDTMNPKYRVHVLPSGKVHRRRIQDTTLTKIGKRMGLIDSDNHDLAGIAEVNETEDEDDTYIDEVMRQREPSDEADFGNPRRRRGAGEGGDE